MIASIIVAVKDRYRAACCLFVLFLMQICPIFGQYGNHYNIWYFGFNAGFDFSTFPPQSIPGSQISKNRPSAVWCDASGKLVLYTDGMTVWNGQNVVIATGPELGGLDSAADVLIMPLPERPDEFYIFISPYYESVNQNRQIHYARIDMKANGGVGAVVEKGVLGGPHVGPAMTGVISCRTDKNWFIYHDVIGPVHVYRVHPSGLIKHATYDVPYHGWYYSMKYNARSGFLTLAAEDGILLNKFDANTGVLTVYEFISLSPPDTGGYYYRIHEFSLSGRYLHILQVRLSEGEEEFKPNVHWGVVQVDLTVTPPSKIPQTAMVLGEYRTIVEPLIPYIRVIPYRSFGDFQLAPDGKIYITMYNHDSLSVINYPDNRGLLCDFRSNAVYLQHGVCASNFPHNLQILDYIPLDTPEILLLHEGDVCDTVSSFHYTLRNYNSIIPYDYYWTIDGKPLPDTGEVLTVHGRTGRVCIHLRYYDQCDIAVIRFEDSACYTIDYPLPVEIVVKQPFELRCDSVLHPLIVSGVHGYPPYEYAILGGQFTRDSAFFHLRSGEKYQIVVRDSRGCTDTLVYRVEAVPPLQITEVRTEKEYCNLKNGKISVSADGVGPFSYSLDGVRYFTTPVFEHLSSGEYTVYVRDSFGCVKSTEVYVGEHSLIDYLQIHTTLDSCSAAKGTIAWSVSNPSLEVQAELNGQHPSNDAQFTNLPAGRYNLRLYDALGCMVDTLIEVDATPPVRIESIDLEELKCFDTETGVSISVSGGIPPMHVSFDRNAYQPYEERYILSTGYHLLTVIDAIGCRADTSFEIHAREEGCEIFKPTAFTPNGDGQNDVFRILYGEGLEGYYQEFKIFNRWGELVFSAPEESALDTGWDGTYRGEDAPVGVYCYIAIAHLNGKIVRIKGDVTLIR